jgi:hypothetical protein
LNVREIISLEKPHNVEFVVESSQLIEAEVVKVWKYVTDVDGTAYPHPAIFKILGVPRPLRAELKGAGVGAARTAWFDNRKRFTQVVSEWSPPTCLRFSFTADPDFRVGYLFDLSCGPFRIIEGWYRLHEIRPVDEVRPMATLATLGTRYFCSINRILIIPWIIRGVLLAYQRFLLRMIKANCEAGAR